MTLVNPNQLNYSAIKMLARETAVNLNAASPTEKALFTVPAGTKLIVDHVEIHTFSADPANAVITFGATGGNCDEFLGDQTLTGITGSYATQCLKLTIPPNSTPVVNTVFAAAAVFGMEITTAAGGACTCTIEVWGHLIDA